MSTRWVICGGRNFTNTRFIWSELDQLVRVEGAPEEVITGGAMGVDQRADDWAAQRTDIATRTVMFAQWGYHGKLAGPIRNQKMLDAKPTLVVAFPGGNGTADMVRRAMAAGVRVVQIATPTTVGGAA